MNVIEIQSYGAPEVLVPATRPDPVAGAGELLIRVSASGINRPDVLQRTGNYPVPPGASDIPGLEVAGVVVSGDAAAMAEVLEAFHPAVVSFHFGLPAPDLLARVKATGAVVMSSASAVEEARWLQAQGADLRADLLLVPLLAFDRKGFRLGYGGGFYDRTLEKLRTLKTVAAVGVAYHAQLSDEVPVGPHDAPLDYVMTERETFACG